MSPITFVVEVHKVRPILLAIGCIFTLLPALPAQEGRLSKVRDEIQDRTPHAGASSDSNTSSSLSGDPEYDPLGEAIGEGLGWGLVAAVAGPFVIPRHLLADHGEELFFPRHPYDLGYRGYLTPPALASPSLAEKWGANHPPATWMGRLSFENGNDFSGLNRFQGQFLLDTTIRFGVVTNWDHFDEHVPRGRGDQTTIGDLTFTYRFAQSERFLMRTGLGFRTLTDEHVTDWGVNFHYGAEWFPRPPLVLTGSVDLGSLGSAFVVRTRGSIGVIWRGWEAFTGYDLLRIGDVNLHGPMVGLRFWF